VRPELLLEPLARDSVVVLRSASNRCSGPRPGHPRSPFAPPPEQLVTAAVIPRARASCFASMAAIRALTRQGLDLHGIRRGRLAGTHRASSPSLILSVNGAQDAELLACYRAHRSGGFACVHAPRHGRRGDKSRGCR